MADLHPTPRLPQELLDTIIGFLHNRKRDLRSCSLTACSLLPTAQSHIFCDISVFHPKNATDDPLTAQEDRVFTSAAFGCLCGALSDSPHLKRHIRSASITTDLGVVILLADMDLSNLCELDLYSDGSGGLDGPLIEPLQRLIGLPSIRRLAFNFATQDSTLEIPLPALDLDAPRTAITHLALENSPATADWLIDTDCPFEFTHLVDVTIIASMSDSLRLLVASAQLTIQGITLAAEDIAPAPFDLAPLSALTRIHLRVPHVWDIVHLFPSISDLNYVNAIRTITFHLEDFDESEWTADVEAHLVQFDSALAKLPFPALKEVVVLLPQSDEPGNDSKTEAMLMRALPLLNQRQVLCIAFRSYTQDCV
ncbi:hypothetical protein B0H13DRAFT_1925041 [Mycena leptocephala]|nr:hypothetical protein B0H13DRAFT_1925041 [Mycena leptocephala]